MNSTKESMMSIMSSFHGRGGTTKNKNITTKQTNWLTRSQKININSIKNKKRKTQNHKIQYSIPYTLKESIRHTKINVDLEQQNFHKMVKSFQTSRIHIDSTITTNYHQERSLNLKILLVNSINSNLKETSCYIVGERKYTKVIDVGGTDIYNYFNTTHVIRESRSILILFLSIFFKVLIKNLVKLL